MVSSVTYFGVFIFGTSYLGAKIKPWPKFPDLRYLRASPLFPISTASTLHMIISKQDIHISREATHRFRTSNNAKSNPEIKGRNSIFFRDDALRVSGHELFTSTPHVFLLNIFINKTERSIHFYWIHFLNKIVTWLTREYVYLWYRLLEINVGTRDTAADEML